MLNPLKKQETIAEILLKMLTQKLISTLSRVCHTVLFAVPTYG